MSDDLICDSCGAHLPLPDIDGNIICPSCGRASRVEVPEEDDRGNRLTVKSPAGEVTIDLSQWTPGARGATEWDRPAERIVMATEAAEGAAKAAKTGCSIAGVVVTLIILASIGGVVFAVVNGVSSVSKSIGEITGTSNSNLYPSSGSVTVLPGEGTTADLVLVATDNSSDSKRRLVRAKVGPTARRPSGRANRSRATCTRRRWPSRATTSTPPWATRFGCCRSPPAPRRGGPRSPTR
ncbi:MAG: hypothetical protein R2746_04455 [Acidimicrobiales bacterium]